MLRALGLHGLRVLVEIGAKKLPQIRVDGAFPGDGENFSDGRGIFFYGHASGSLNFMEGVGIGAAGPQGALHFGLIFADRGCVTAQRG